MTEAMHRIWAARHDAPAETECRDADDWLYLAALAIRDRRRDDATRYARTAADRSPADGLAAALAGYLGDVTRHDRDLVYTDPAAFQAYIRGGGNVRLYQSLTGRLGDLYRRYRPESLLDIGVGDGEALLPSLTADVGAIDLLEPSQSLLDATMDALAAHPAPVRGHHGTVQELVAGRSGFGVGARWNLVQATFSLHNLSPADRRDALRWLVSRTDRLVIAEFDIAASTEPEPDWFATVAQRYRRGLAEYADDGGLVAAGFLMPMLVGYFDPDVAHHEQSAASWCADLEAAGFGCTVSPVSDYWWAPGVLIEAMPR